MALGSLFRRRGEVDRAIRFHQNIIAKPGLEPDQRTVALGDAGATVFYSEIDAIDILGLNDIDIAKEGFSVEDLLERSPGFIVLKSSDPGRMIGSRSEYGEYSDEIFNHPDFQEEYKVLERFTTLAPFYSLWIFGRVDQ